MDNAIADIIYTLIDTEHPPKQINGSENWIYVRILSLTQNPIRYSVFLLYSPKVYHEWRSGEMDLLPEAITSWGYLIGISSKDL